MCSGAMERAEALAALVSSARSCWIHRSYTLSVRQPYGICRTIESFSSVNCLRASRSKAKPSVASTRLATSELGKTWMPAAWPSGDVDALIVYGRLHLNANR